MGWLNPAAVFAQPSPGDDIMHMWMLPQGLPPGVKDAVEADLAAQPLRIAAESKKRCRRTFKQQVVYQASVVADDIMQEVWQGEDDVVVSHRENIFDSMRNPLLTCDPLAFGAVPVPAGIVLFLAMPAAIALVDVITVLGRTAMGNGVHHLVLSGSHGVVVSIVLPMGSEDIGDFPLGCASMIRGSNQDK